MPKIEKLYAFICEEMPGDEGLMAFCLEGAWYPMVGANGTRIESLREMAQGLVDKVGRPATLAVFSHREDVETIKPVEPVETIEPEHHHG